ncbi:hypothetical protein [Flavobacterium sp. Root186]|uniref:hypothetical protein n=1 Tax=Flavobacterium sp. Root186 TaxID=1736485 RepID=UPI0006F49D7E|nr:hypothetical protein [Flavobacterium sp. Root186]KRB56485.1 hypothetical protein ASD98_11560 [Flavobacterium sp. Root186]
MKITLQRKIAVLWFALSIFNAINYVCQIIRLRGTFGSFGDSVFTTSYFAQIFSYELFEMFIPISDENLYFVYQLEWYSNIVLTLLSILIPVILFFNLKYSRTTAKAFLILFILFNVWAIFIKMTLFLPVADELSKYEIMINKKVANYIHYYSAVLLIAILMSVGLFYKSKKEESIETI